MSIGDEGKGVIDFLRRIDAEIKALPQDDCERCAVRQEVIEMLRSEVIRLDALINNPHTDVFLDAVRLEAAHQRERWAEEHDAGKTAADWFWLIGYVCGKALSKPEKRLHHIVTTAAVCLNWHAHASGNTDMHPGVASRGRG